MDVCYDFILGAFKKNAQPPSTVSEVFRSLVSLCKEEPISVMMPLLSTGNQVVNQSILSIGSFDLLARVQ